MALLSAELGCRNLTAIASSIPSPTAAGAFRPGIPVGPSAVYGAVPKLAVLVLQGGFMASSAPVGSWNSNLPYTPSRPRPTTGTASLPLTPAGILAVIRAEAIVAAAALATVLHEALLPSIFCLSSNEPGAGTVAGAASGRALLPIRPITPVTINWAVVENARLSLILGREFTGLAPRAFRNNISLAVHEANTAGHAANRPATPFSPLAVGMRTCWDGSPSRVAFCDGRLARCSRARFNF
mmetsp:Transcript_87137/g.154242  ORF Transcript_87137/g.154242 Transcript_87137/m.154242 type:complete len:240 (+) Transcript_87137:2208-2927(+)